MNFPSSDGAAPFSFGAWLPVSCIGCLRGMLKFKTQNENKLNLESFSKKFFSVLYAEKSSEKQGGAYCSGDPLFSVGGTV